MDSIFGFLSTAQADLLNEILARHKYWEPTDYAQAVGAVLAQFNAACLNEWP